MDKSRIFVGSLEEIFHKQVELIGALDRSERSPAVVALTGGSTPKAFYKWLNESQALKPDECGNLVWTTSDERCVPIESDESNFGNAARGFLDPLGFDDRCRRPWPVHLSPSDAAASYSSLWAADTPLIYDLCFVGMGDDGHTLSLFPDCPLLSSNCEDAFSATEWPGRGWRLTLTPAGLNRCRWVVPVVTGAAKAAKLREVFHSSGPVAETPIRLLHTLGDRVYWLLDTAAAVELDLS